MLKKDITTYHKETIKQLEDEVKALKKENTELRKQAEQNLNAVEKLRDLYDATLSEYENDMQNMKVIGETAREMIRISTIEKQIYEEQVTKLIEKLKEYNGTAELKCSVCGEEITTGEYMVTDGKKICSHCLQDKKE